MPASSLFAEMERPTSTPCNTIPNNSTVPMDDQRTLQLALELSLLGIQSDPLSQQQQLQQSLPTTLGDEFSPLSLDDRSKRSQNMTECVAVPSSEHVAEIVGRQGCKIKALRAKTNTYIKTPVRGEEPVFVVTGRKEDVAMAKREILSAAEHFSQIRACRKNNLNGSLAPGPPTNVPGQVTIQVRVPYRVVGLVVGPKGATIKRIQQQSHTYIVTPSRDKEPVFEVTGLPDSVDQARKEIEAHIAMRTGGLLDQEDTGNVTVAAAAAAANVVGTGRNDFAGSHSLDNLFNANELLYKLSASSGTNGFGTSARASNMAMNGGSSLNGLNSLGPIANLNALNLGATGSFGDILNSMPPMDASCLFDGTNSLFGGSKGATDNPNSLFSSLGGTSLGGTLGTKDLNGQLGSLYNNVDEGLGSLGSSMGSSPSFDPAPSSIWGDIGRSISTSLTSSSTSNGGSMSSTMSSLSSLTRRSSSVSGTSPPSSRLSPTLESPHPPARRICSDPMSFVQGHPPATNANSTGSSPSSTPELCLTNGFGNSGTLPTASLSSLSSAGLGTGTGSGSCSPTMEKRCRACSENPIVAALVPCGHNLYCMDCANQLVSESGKCTHCFEEVTQAIRIFT